MILKVKDYLIHKDKQYKIVEPTITNGYVAQRVLRLKDNKTFTLGSLCKVHGINEGIIFLKDFCHDLIHVEIRILNITSDKKFDARTETIQINDLQ